MADIPVRRITLQAAALLGAALAVGAGAPRAGAAESADVVPMTKTVLTLKVQGADVPIVRSRFVERPPSIILEFPGQRLTGWLPDDLAQSGGAVERIIAEHGRRTIAGKPFIRSLQVVLRGSYGHRVRAERGRIIVEIDHPATVGGTAVDVGFKSRLKAGGELGEERLERFRAMQRALAEVTPTPWTLSLRSASPPLAVEAGSAQLSSPSEPQRAAAAPHTAKPAAWRLTAIQPARRNFWPWWSALALSLLLLAGASLWALRNARALLAWWRPATGLPSRVPSSIQLIDQLVWRAFERQGYSLVDEHELTPSPGGPLRVAVKDGMTSGVLFAGQGPFFEKQTVQRFANALRAAGVEQGVLVASGAFTVPAQRLASEHRITLIGRDQLVELLSAGARGELMSKQLESQQAELDEAKATLKHYADELDDLRRQRNEASWLLGEERARAGALDQELETVRQDIGRRQEDVERLGREALTLKRQWEESQWYLGESRASARHALEQLAQLQDALSGHAEAERQLQDAQRLLNEERTARQSLEQHAADLTRQFDEAAEARERLEGQVRRLADELDALRSFGERRTAARGSLGSIRVELSNGADEPLFLGVPRDISRHGIGVQTDAVIQARDPLRARLFLPGLLEPLETKAELRWQRPAGESGSHESGFRLLGLTERAEDAIDLLLGHEC